MFLTLAKRASTSTALATLANLPSTRLIDRLRHRQTVAQRERDMVTITATLARLNERQLNRIGLSRSTLAFDIDAMAQRAEREQSVGHDLLRLVGPDTPPMIAAE